jgi:hypothetical protein
MVFKSFFKKHPTVLMLALGVSFFLFPRPSFGTPANKQLPETRVAMAASTPRNEVEGEISGYSTRSRNRRERSVDEFFESNDVFLNPPVRRRLKDSHERVFNRESEFLAAALYTALKTVEGEKLTLGDQLALTNALSDRPAEALRLTNSPAPFPLLS